MIFKLKTCQKNLYFINIINILKICLNFISCPDQGRELRMGRKQEKEKETLEKPAVRMTGPVSTCSAEALRRALRAPERGKD